MKKILAIIMMVLGVFTSSFGADNSLKDIQKKGKMIVGLDATFAPMGFRDEAGNIVGFDIDLANEVAKRLGVTAEFKPCEWDGILFDLKGKKIDMVWNGMTITEAREKQALFSEPYFEDGQMIFSRKENKIDKVAELEGKVVGLQLGSSADVAVAKNPISQKTKEIKKYATNVEALMDLEAGRLDAVVVDAVNGKYYNSKKNALAYSTESLTTEYYGVAFRKSDKEFRNEVQKALDEMKKDGTYDKIVSKWFGE
ncbi:MAG: amino acid ABC transporter substrate-binding protein [Fusobacterium perfoetens]|uniref:amino acid ABC transporter substrate-binding protein n=1 Tax=Fusobacterium perfoetens TaxID=852 RepID=UPI0023F4F275|nr:amino acid ABC transporter substrate-binding protein [Fusobacterium perfoetens]MCI6152878.1 amino acid ABC transporter substrate-binding protein [Fusobacterium perfoetens]MDY3237290.1 amino acid ABC transporter substrate-binding protein [Fusobacterium perfoetens]